MRTAGLTQCEQCDPAPTPVASDLHGLDAACGERLAETLAGKRPLLSVCPRPLLISVPKNCGAFLHLRVQSALLFDEIQEWIHLLPVACSRLLHNRWRCKPL